MSQLNWDDHGITRESVTEAELQIIRGMRFGVMDAAKTDYDEYSSKVDHPAFASDVGFGAHAGMVFVEEAEPDALEAAKTAMKADKIWAIYGRRTPGSEPEFVTSWDERP